MPRNVAYHLDFNFLRAPRALGAVRLHQLGRMHCNPGTVVEAHAHIDWFELTAVTAGTGYVFTGEEPTRVTRGDIYLSFPCEVHKIVSEERDPLQFDFLSFSPIDAGLSEALNALAVADRAPGARVFQSERIQSLMQSALGEPGAGKFGEELQLSALLTQIAVRLVRKQGEPAASKSPKDAAGLCYRTMRYIDTHLYAIGGVGEIAAAMGYSAGYLSAVFKRTRGETLSQYYQKKRFEAARVLVGERRLKITEIANLVGYGSVFAFSKAYRNYFGCSPNGNKRGRA